MAPSSRSGVSVQNRACYVAFGGHAWEGLPGPSRRRLLVFERLWVYGWEECLEQVGPHCQWHGVGVDVALDG